MAQRVSAVDFTRIRSGVPWKIVHSLAPYSPTLVESKNSYATCTQNNVVPTGVLDLGENTCPRISMAQLDIAALIIMVARNVMSQGARKLDFIGAEQRTQWEAPEFGAWNIFQLASALLKDATGRVLT